MSARESRLDFGARPGDSHETRKAIADAMLAGARTGTRSLMQFQEIGFAKLKEIVRPRKRRWLWWRR